MTTGLKFVFQFLLIVGLLVATDTDGGTERRCKSVFQVRVYFYTMYICCCFGCVYLCCTAVNCLQVLSVRTDTLIKQLSVVTSYARKSNCWLL